ncbi:related to COX18 - mitochondrial inner membrane protein required for membrane insertion of C-terminus of Cox2p [Ustilago trichophora]|uniref:Related to COX18 - mitochondrial inner membrane protein required for membrane insertion of C-terminus of Cox2p n=1 Tax=Ustilago trichophora TaxID=86804 RepID=A0A5C3E5W8_9BASI|nr:related to COX18 - mitochondrial inner membrane protein required for membrane insertion of C-terminus of Cox2p [Ustilago trichophora]
MASTGVFRIAVAGIRTRAPVTPTASSSFSRISLPSRFRSSGHRGFASSTAAFSAAPLTSPIPAANAAATSSAETASTTTQAVAEPEIVTAGFEFLEPWVPTIQNLAETLHFTGPHANALAIFVLAFAVRTVVTLPVTLWQRSKTRKLTEQVLPEWEIMKEQIPLQVRAKCRRAGMSYEAFHKEAQKELKTALTALLRKHNVSPMPAFIGPATISIPVFLLMTALLRQSALDPASPFATEVLPWWSPSPELAQQFKSSTAILADRGFDEAAISKLQGTMGGPTLVDKDSTMIGPLSFGMLTLANTELNSWSRRSLAKIRAVTSGETDAADRTAEKLLAAGSKDPAEATGEEEPRRVRIITNALRVMAIGFIPIACQAPGVLVIYWLSSGIYTLIQNSILAVMDRRSEVIKATRKQQLLQQQQQRR